MKYLHLTFIFLLSNLNSYGQSIEELTSQILGGVKEISISGTPGELKVFGKKAVSVLTDKDGKSVLAVAPYGKGRTAAISFEVFVDIKKNQNDPNSHKLMANLIQWLLKGKQPKKIFSYGYQAQNYQVYFPKPQFDFQSSPKSPSNLKQYDLVFVNFSSFNTESLTVEEINDLKAYVRDGGAVIGTGMGWVYQAYGRGKSGYPLNLGYTANQFFLEMGLCFAKEYAQPKIEIKDSKGNANHFQKILSRSMEILKGANKPPVEELNKIYYDLLSFKNLDLKLSEFLTSEEIKFFTQLYESQSKTFVITEKNKIAPDKNPELVVLSHWIDFITQLQEPSAVRKMVHADDFPGAIPNGSQRITQTILVDGKTQWESTGLYAPAGEVISVTLSEEAAQQGFKIRIGSHKYSLQVFTPYCQQWSRFPQISLEKPLFKTRQEFASPHGGLIYIVRPFGLADNFKPFTLEVQGAVQAPYFKLGVHKDDDWNRLIKNYPAPWGEVASGNLVITLPTDTLKKLENPSQVMGWWEKVVALYPQLLSLDPSTTPDQRFVADRQTVIGYMHSGYPIATHLDVAEFVLGVAKNPLQDEGSELFKTGSWGHFHELGHNFQNPLWTFTGSGEVTVNIFTLFAMESILGIPPFETTFLQKNIEKAKKYIIEKKTFKEWAKEPFVGLILYAQLKQAFGWDGYKKVFAYYNSLDKKLYPKTDQEKIDLWVRVFSKTVQRNLIPFFTTWGLPTTEPVAKELKDLPIWNELVWK